MSVETIVFLFNLTRALKAALFFLPHTLPHCTHSLLLAYAKINLPTCKKKCTFAKEKQATTNGLTD